MIYIASLSSLLPRILDQRSGVVCTCWKVLIHYNDDLWRDLAMRYDLDKFQKPSSLHGQLSTSHHCSGSNLSRRCNPRQHVTIPSVQNARKQGGQDREVLLPWMWLVRKNTVQSVNELIMGSMEAEVFTSSGEASSSSIRVFARSVSVSIAKKRNRGLS